MKHVRGFKYPSCVANDRGTEKGGRGKKKKKGGECAMHLCLFELGGQLRAPEFARLREGTFVLSQENGASNFFERLWWYPLFRYFERNVQGVVPRHYEWPFPWPRRWSSKNPQRTS